MNSSSNKFFIKNKITFIFIAVLFFLTSCRSTEKAETVINKKYAPAALRNDVSLLQQILEANHPSLYWYTPKDSMDNYFRESINSITDSLNEFQFKNKVAWLISKIRCGHTSVEFSKQYAEAIAKIKQPQFPLAIKTWGDSLVILGNLFPNDTLLKRGTVITSINNMDPHVMLDSMFQFISTDGYDDNFKSQVTSFNFAAAYENCFRFTNSYIIHYADSAGIDKAAGISNYLPYPDTSKRKIENHFHMINPFRSVVFDTLNSSAYMRLAGFSGGRLRNFFRET
jgi:hypothetical protein